MKFPYKYNLCEFSDSLQNNFKAYLWLLPAAILRMRQYLNVRSLRIRLGSPAFMHILFSSLWLFVFQHNLNELFFSDLCQLVLAETVPPGSDQPCHWMPPSQSDKKLFVKCWNHFPSLPLRPRREEEKKRTLMQN